MCALQSRKYWTPGPDASPPVTLPDFDFSVRAMIPANALFSVIYSAAAHSTDQFTALMKLRNPQKWAKFHTAVPLDCDAYITKEAAGYWTVTFGPTTNNGDLSLQIIMSATRKKDQWSVPVATLQAGVVQKIWEAGLAAWFPTDPSGENCLFTGHSLGGACAYLMSRRQPGRSSFNNFICTVGALKVSNGVEKDYVRKLDTHMVSEGDPVPDFPPDGFASANPDWTPINFKSPMELSRYESNRTRWVIAGNGALTEPDFVKLPVVIDGVLGTINTAAKLTTFTNHSIENYMSRARAPGGLVAFDPMVKAIGM